MGYSHYWQGLVPSYSPELHSAVAFIFADAAKNNVELGAWHGMGGNPVNDEVEISFNGVNVRGETFTVIYGQSVSLNFCKTGQEDYDTSVVAVLDVLRHFGKGEFVWSSDGAEMELEEGRSLACLAIMVRA